MLAPSRAVEAPPAADRAASADPPRPGPPTPPLPFAAPGRTLLDVTNEVRRQVVANLRDSARDFHARAARQQKRGFPVTARAFAAHAAAHEAIARDLERTAG